MITGQEGFVDVAYAVSALTLAVLIGSIMLEQRARRREMTELEKAGLARRSQRKTGTTQ
jgi:heme exporter protein D